jgi:5-methylcytosine-specific restriction endonuclease McrA
MPPGWARTRARILTRDGHACRQCGNPATEVHHAVDGREDDDSLISLCSACHRRITAVKARAARHG